MESKTAKYIFITGGVVSSLGKGITAASLGTLLKARGLRGHRAAGEALRSCQLLEGCFS